MKKRFVIIGSGLGGLSCGVLLAKNGYDVTILEQDAQIGGCLQCFSRRGVKFETGMHFIGSCDEGQFLWQLLTYLDVLKDIRLSRLDTTAYEEIIYKGDHYYYANGREAFVETLSENFRDEKDNLASYYDLVHHVAESSTLRSICLGGSPFGVDTQYQLLSVDEVLESFGFSPDLTNILLGEAPLYAARKGKTPFSLHAFLMNFYNQSAFRIVGGSDSVAKSLQHTLEQYGGRILTRKKVVDIVCGDEFAEGVTTQDNEYYPADYVISTVHPVRTIEMLNKSRLIRPVYKDRLRGIENTPGVFSLYLKFKENSVPYMNRNVFSYQESGPWTNDICNNQDWPGRYLYMHGCDDENQQYAKTGTVLAYMNIDDLAQWLESYVGNRGEDYCQFKELKALKVIDALEIDYPGIREKIESYYTSTPLTYRDYTGTEAGSIYGVARNIQSGPNGRISHRTKIPNLLLAGQSIYSHGIQGVLVGTLIACGEIIGLDTIYKQINEAIHG